MFMDMLLLQNYDELEVAQKLLGDRFEKLKIIAWTPFAVDILREKNIPYTTIADHLTEYYNPQRYISQIKQFKEWCDIVDNHVSSSVPEVASLQIRPFLNKLLPLRVEFFLYFNEMDKLNLLLNALKVHSVYYFYYPEPQLSLLSRLMDIIGGKNKHEVNFVRLEPKDKYKSVFPKDGLVPDWFDQKNKFYNIAKYIIQRPKYKSLSSLISGLTGYRLFKKREYNILVLSLDWDVKNILILLKQQIDCNFIFWEDVPTGIHKKINIPVRSIIEKLKNDLDAHHWTTYQGNDIFNVFIPEIEKILINDVPRFISTVRKFKKMHNRFNFDIVIAPMVMTPHEAIFDQCENLDIPCVTFLHGGTVGLIEGYPLIGLCPRGRRKEVDLFHIVYSEALVEFCDNLKMVFPSFTAKNISAGSNYFEKLVKNGKDVCWGISSHLKICYVCSGIGVFNVGTKRGLYDDASLYELRHKIIDKFINRTDFCVFYKLGYNSENYELAFEKKIINGFWKNIKAVPSHKKLIELLDEMDVFILETPSTTLFEVLTTTKPVILLIDPRALDITDDAKKLLENRVTIVRSSNELEVCIQDIIENGINARAFTLLDHKDNAFIVKYATCGEGNSLKRSVDFLEAVLKQRNNHKFLKNVDVRHSIY